MADLNSSLESSGLSAEEATTTTPSTTAASTSTAVASSCEAMLWEGWSSHTSGSTTDEASTSNITLLPELTTPTSSSSRFHGHHSDILCNLLSGFHPLAVHPQTSDDNANFLHQLDHSESEATTVSFGEPSRASTYLTGIPSPLPKRDDQISQWRASQWPQTSVPESREFLKWDATPWPSTTTIQLFHDEEDSSHMRDVVSGFGPTHQTSKKLEHFSGFGNVADHPHSEMNPVFVLSPTVNQSSSTAWIPTSTSDRTSDRGPELPFTRSQQLLDFVRNAQDHQRFTTSTESSEQVTVTSLGGDSRKQNRRGGDEFWNGPASKRSHAVDGLAGTMMWRNQDSREDFATATRMRRVGDSPPYRSGGVWTTNGGSSSSSISSSASQAMELFAMGPALNTNGKPRARRGSATDPQSVYARHRREKINERLKTLQHLVPNGTKVDIVTMLDEAVHYVQFLQLQVKLLKSDKYWTYATPNIYKGIDLTNANQPTQMQGMGSSA